MRRIFTIAAVLLMTVSVWAQAPEKMSYQAVVRNSSNVLVSSTTVGMQISILQGSTSGTVVYTETHAPTTNANGLVSLEIGTGTTSDDFSTIDWANGPFFIQTETDPTGGTNYTITGTSQLLSVPYALHANVADSIVGGVSITETDPTYSASQAANITSTDITNLGNLSGTNTGDQTVITTAQANEITSNAALIASLEARIAALETPPIEIGDFINGGIVFWIDPMDNTKGLVTALVDQSTFAEWGCFGTTITGADGIAVGTGAQNTIDIEAGCATGGTAADICANLSLNGFDDWFLPSLDELSLMYENIGQGNALGLGNVGGFSSSGGYWSSTENSDFDSRGVAFSSSGFRGFAAKSGLNLVRAVRAF